MIQGLYSGAAALDVITKQQESISYNLAHLNTGGHRKSRMAVTQRTDERFADRLNDLGPKVEDSRIDFTPGRLHHTGGQLDVAISGDGFFAIEGNGGEMYTRNGRFQVNPETRVLINQEGFPALGEDGPITLATDYPISISEDGTITANGETLGKLRIVAFEDNQKLIPMDAIYFMAGADAETTASAATVQQGHMEYSNVNPVSELVALIVGSRQYEAVQRASRTISETVKENIRA